MPRPKKESTKTKIKSEAANSPTLTPEERAITQRVAGQDTSWHTIREDELNDFSLSEDPYKLPKAAQKLQDKKEYAFRWVVRTPGRIDEITRTAPIHRRWTLATRTTMPKLKADIDPVLGCVCRDDQCLMFRPWFYHMQEREMKEALAEANYASGSLSGKKQQIMDRDDDVRVFNDKRAVITGRDEVFYDESSVDVGDLVATD